MQRTNGIQLVLGMSAISARASGQVTVSGCVPAVGSPVTFGFKEQGLEAFSEQISGAVTKPRPRSHRDKPQEHRGWWQCLSWAGGTAALGVSTQLLGHRPVSPLPSSISRWAAPNHVHSAADSSQWGCQAPFPSLFSHPKLTTSLLPGLRSSPQTALPSLKSRLKDVMGGRGGDCVCTHCFCCCFCCWDCPAMQKALKMLTGEPSTHPPVCSGGGHRTLARGAVSKAWAAKCPHQQCVTKHLGQTDASAHKNAWLRLSCWDGTVRGRAVVPQQG